MISDSPFRLALLLVAAVVCLERAWSEKVEAGQKSKRNDNEESRIENIIYSVRYNMDVG
jgi:hypothetical protein